MKFSRTFLLPPAASFLLLLAGGVVKSQVQFQVPSPGAQQLQPLTKHDQALILYNEGVRLASKHQEPEALEKFKAALETDPKCSLAQYGCGTVLLQMGQPKDALPALLKFVELKPEAVHGWQALSACYSQMGDLANAVEALKNFRRLSPGGSRGEKLDKQIKFLEAQVASSKPQNMDAPDYLQEMEDAGLLRWLPDKMPLKIYIRNGKSVAHFRQDFVPILKQSFEEWTRASDGHVSFVFVDDSAAAQIECCWTEDSRELPFPGEAGHAELVSEATLHKIQHATIRLLTTNPFNGKPVSDEQAHATDLHEIGHSLGLRHSVNPRDIMFLTKAMVAPALSERDTKTLIALYSVDEEHLRRSPIDFAKVIQPGAEDTIPIRVARLNTEAVSDLQKKDFDAAEAKLKKALQLKPNDEISSANLAGVYIGQSSLALEARDFAKAEQLGKLAISLLETTPYKEPLIKQLKWYAQFLEHFGRTEEASLIKARVSKLEASSH